MSGPTVGTRILHGCQVLIDKSVPRVTVWHSDTSDEAKA